MSAFGCAFPKAAPGHNRTVIVSKHRTFKRLLRSESCRIANSCSLANPAVGLIRRIGLQSFAYLPFGFERPRTAAFPSSECELPTHSGRSDCRRYNGRNLHEAVAQCYPSIGTASINARPDPIFRGPVVLLSRYPFRLDISIYGSIYSRPAAFLVFPSRAAVARFIDARCSSRYQ